MAVYLLLFTCSAVLSYLLAYPVRWLALRLDVVDHPEKRKIHQIPIPLLGGLAIFLSFALVSLVGLTALGDLEPFSRSYAGLMIGATLIVLLGIYDDVKGLRAAAKFAGQTVAALVVVVMGARVDLFTNPLGDSFQIGWLGYVVAVLWIVGVTNALNLMDGLDGLAAGIGAIAALGLFAVAYPGLPLVAGLAIILAGAAAGFLKHNFYPARLFLGDTGSMLIGFVLAVMSLHGYLKTTTAAMLFLPIIVLGVPIFDTLFAIFRRARQKVSLFSADREHIHHRLVRIGLHHRKVVLVLYFVCAYLSLTAYSMVQIPYQTVFLFLVLLTIGGILGLSTLRFIEERMEAGIVKGSAPVAVRTPASGKAARRRERSGNSSNWLGEGFSTMVCEVGGFCEDLAQPVVVDEMCAEISNMLSRRLRVFNVVAEPVGPGRLLIVLRTERLVPKTTALVQDGVAWYLEEHKTWYSGEKGFPLIRWIRPDSEAWHSKDMAVSGGPDASKVLTTARKPVYGP